jgi:6-phosphogluconolactonase
MGRRPRLTAEIVRFADLDAASQAAANIVTSHLQDGLLVRAFASLAVCGGKTPRRTFEILADRDLDWPNIAVTLTDERWVPRWEVESNERLVRHELLVGRARSARLASMWSPTPEPQQGIPVYEALLDVMPERFDVVLIGMGEDGHIASLFPGSGALTVGLDPEAQARCVAVPIGAAGPPHEPRMSLTLAELIRARAIVLLTSGAAKKRVLERSIREVRDPFGAPVAALLAHRPDTHVLHAE